MTGPAAQERNGQVLATEMPTGAGSSPSKADWSSLLDHIRILDFDSAPPVHWLAY